MSRSNVANIFTLTFTYNTFNTPNIANFSPNELVFGRKTKLLLSLETIPDDKVSGTFKDYYNLFGDLVYIISPLTGQLYTASKKVMIKYVGQVVIYKIIDLHNYLLMMLDGKILI